MTSPFFAVMAFISASFIPSLLPPLLLRLLLPTLLPSFLQLFLICQSPSVWSQGVVGGGVEENGDGGGGFPAGLPPTPAPVPQIPQVHKLEYTRNGRIIGQS